MAIQRVEKGALGQNPLAQKNWKETFSLPGYYEVPKEDFRVLAPLNSLLLSSNLGENLQRWYGEKDEDVPGKYRKAQAFYFNDGEGGVIAAFCEKGDRGSSWWWAPAPNHPKKPSRNRGNVLFDINEAPRGWLELCIEIAENAECDKLGDINAKKCRDVLSSFMEETGMEEISIKQTEERCNESEKNEPNKKGLKK